MKIKNKIIFFVARSFIFSIVKTMKINHKISTILIGLLVLSSSSCDNSLIKSNTNQIQTKRDASLRLENEWETDAKEVTFSIDNQTKKITRSDSQIETILFENLQSNKDLSLTIRTVYDNAQERITTSDVNLIPNKINSYNIKVSLKTGEVLIPIDFKAYDSINELIANTNELIANTLANGNGEKTLKIKKGRKHVLWFKAKANKEYNVHLASSKGNVDLYGYTNKNDFSKTISSNSDIKIKTTSEGFEKFVSGCYVNQPNHPYNKQKASCTIDNGKYDNVLFNSYKEQIIYLMIDSPQSDSEYKIRFEEKEIPVDTDYFYVNGINTISGIPEDKETFTRTIEKKSFNKETGQGSTLETVSRNNLKNITYTYSKPKYNYLNDAILDLGEFNLVKNESWYETAGGFISDLKDIKEFLKEKGSVEESVNDINKINLKGIHNPTMPILGKVGDIYEALLQKCPDFKTFQSTLIASINATSSAKNIPNVSESIRRIIDGIKLGIENSILIDDRKVIIISHSQGNFFTNQAIKELLDGNYVIRDLITKDKLTNFNNRLPSKIAVLGLGSPNRVYNKGINTIYVSNLFDMVSWLDGFNKQNVIDKHDTTFLNKGFEKKEVYSNTNTASSDPSRLIATSYGCYGKDKISNILNFLSSITPCSNNLISASTTNIINTNKSFGTPFSKEFIETDSCSMLGDLTRISGAGLGEYHFLGTGYIKNSSTKQDIIKALKELKSKIK